MRKLTKLVPLIFFSLIFIQCQKNPSSVLQERWSEERAWQWHNENGWMVGTNFNPSTSINQLEFWQEDTYDPETINRELEWSAELGMNMHRVYLHNLLWDQDSIGFLKRVDNYLDISESKGIKTLLVLLDDVWHPIPKLGRQPDPIPFVHNSGWVQAPGSEIFMSPNIAKDAVVPPNVGSVHNEIKGIFASERRFKKLLIFAICINEKAPSIILAPPDLEIINRGALFSIA